MLNVQKNYMNFIMIYRFYLKEKKIEKIEKLVAKLHDNAEYFIQIKKFVTRAKS